MKYLFCIFFLVGCSSAQALAGMKDFFYHKKNNNEIWYDFYNKKAVLKISDHLNKANDSTEYSSGNSMMIYKNKSIYFFLNIQKSEAEIFLKSEKTALFYNYFFPKAEAADCDQSKQALESYSNFTSSLNWSTIKETAKTCSLQVLGQVFDQFSDHITDMYESIKDLAANPKLFFEKLLRSFENLDEVLIEGFKSFFQLIEQMYEVGIESVKHILCQLLGDFTGQIGMAMVMGPSSLKSLGRNLHSFFERVRGYKEFMSLVKSNPVYQRTIIFYSHHLDKLKTHTRFITDGFSNPRELTKHFEKHGASFGAISESDYLQKAEKFAQSRAGLSLEGIGKNTKWDPKTGEFLVLTNDGKIITYFKNFEIDGQNPLEQMFRKLDTNTQKLNVKKLLPSNKPDP